METLSATQYLQPRTQPHSRCTGRRQEQATVGTSGTSADGFLKHTFFPLYQQAENMPEKELTEDCLFSSLHLLQQTFSIQPMDLCDKPYPYNVLLAHWDAEKQLIRLNRNSELLIINDGTQDWKFATKETANTGSTLYYIPLLPIHRLMETGRSKRSAELLLSVCAYLYHCAGIPHYRDEETFLHYQYEMLNDDLQNEWNELDEDNIARNKSALRYASYFGDIMQRRMHNPCHLERFEERVINCRPLNRFQYDCLSVAQDALALWQTYPDAHLFKNADNNSLRENDDEEDDYYNDDNNCIAVYGYVHFIADFKGSIYDSLSEMVNCEFNERQYTQEPTIITRFDKNYRGEKQNLDYEHRLFKLLNDLANILDELP